MKSLEAQIGGTHYIEMPYQPVLFVMKCKFNFCEGNVIKYVARHKSKDGKRDIEKALQYVDIIDDMKKTYPAIHTAITDFNLTLYAREMEAEKFCMLNEIYGLEREIIFNISRGQFFNARENLQRILGVYENVKKS